MSTRDLLFYLREELLKARKDKNLERINELGTACSIIAEAAYAVQERPADAKSARSVAILLEDLECAVRDSFHGVEWKSEIPTDEDIRNATDS